MLFRSQEVLTEINQDQAETAGDVLNIDYPFEISRKLPAQEVSVFSPKGSFRNKNPLSHELGKGGFKHSLSCPQRSLCEECINLFDHFLDILSRCINRHPFLISQLQLDHLFDTSNA